MHGATMKEVVLWLFRKNGYFKSKLTAKLGGKRRAGIVKMEQVLLTICRGLETKVPPLAKCS